MKIQKFQDGGAMAPEGAPQEAQMAAAPQEQADPAQQILAAAAQAVQAQDGQMALQVCQALVEMAQQGGGEPQEEPQYLREGGRLRRIK